MHRGRRSVPSTAVPRRPQREPLDERALEHVRLVALSHQHAEVRRREARQLILHGRDRPSIVREPESVPHELREACRELDDGRAGSQRLGVQVIEHEPRLRTERQADGDKVARRRIDRVAGDNLHIQEPVRALPGASVRAGIAVRQERLAEDRVLVDDPGGIVVRAHELIELSEMRMVRLRPRR